MVIGTLSINYLSSKSDDLKILISGMFDILMITETKLDDTYPVSQLHIDGYSMPYGLDRNRNGGRVIIYARKNIPSTVLRKDLFSIDIEGIFVKIIYRNVSGYFVVLITLHHSLISNNLITLTKH